MSGIRIGTFVFGLCVAACLPLAVWAHPLPEHFFFQPPTNLGTPINTSANDSSPTLSADGLTMVFGSNRPGTIGENDLWITTRSTATSLWNAPVNLGAAV